jgi:hypothetical protein
MDGKRTFPQKGASHLGSLFPNVWEDSRCRHPENSQKFVGTAFAR